MSAVISNRTFVLCNCDFSKLGMSFVDAEDVFGVSFENVVKNVTQR